MPFTPFHLGPALAIGLLLKRVIHLPTFAVANIILDVEPLLVLLLGLNCPMHGIAHTFLATFFVGLGLGYLMSLFEDTLTPVYKALLLEPSEKMKISSFLIAGVLGTMLHVVLDSPLYDDINPLFPLTVNPFYDPSLTIPVYLLCLWTGILVVIYYMASAVLKTYKARASR